MRSKYIDVAYASGVREYRVAPVYQYDKGLFLRISGIDNENTVAMQYGVSGTNQTLNPASSLEDQCWVSTIPNLLMAQKQEIICYITVSAEDTTVTMFSVKIPITEREKPSGYTYTQEELLGYNELMRKFKEQSDEVEGFIEDATTALGNVEKTISAFENMYATASSVTYDTSADAQLSIDKNNRLHFEFSIPEGKDGETPYIGANNHWFIGTSDTGINAKGEQGTPGHSPYIGDNGNWYVGNEDTGIPARGPQGPNGDGAGTVTAVTVSGTTYEPDDTGVVNLGELGGGNGTVKSINGVEADEEGDIPLKLSNVLPDSDETDGTETVLFPVVADNALKLGGKAPAYYTQPYNLLDNSDFRNPVNQRGATSYKTSGYTIDRWNCTNGAGTLSIIDGAVNMRSTSGASTWFVQTIPESSIETGKAYTFAFMTKGGRLHAWSDIAKGSGTYMGGPTINDEGVGVGTARFEYDDNNARYSLVFGVTDTSGVDIKWAALYEGEYTSDTLPPYVPKGYAVELAECKRYYRKIPVLNGYIMGLAFSNTSLRMMLPFDFYKANPKVTYDSAITIKNQSSGGGSAITGMSASYADNSGCMLTITTSGLTAGTAYALYSNSTSFIEISYDT